VWSAILEPLLFFVVFEASFGGITGNISRLLQLATCVLLAGRLALYVLGPDEPKPLAVPDLRRPLYRNYTLMLALAVVAGLTGYARGAYDMPQAYFPVVNLSPFSQLLNSASVRPIFEYITAFYYFAYFTVLPQYLITTRADVEYALSRFKWMFALSFVVGVIDVVSSAMGHYFVPRHLSSWEMVDRGRFHGLAGEPREAFGYLFLGLAMLHLDAYLRGRRLDRRWLLGIIVAAALTQSTTGLVAIALFVGLYGTYSVLELNPKRIVQVAAGFVLLGAVAYQVTINTPRMMAYFDSAKNLWYILETHQNLPDLMSKSNSDIYPLYDLTVKARDGDWLPVLIGSGMGSASAVANRYYRQWAELNNPHSQLARSLYETGLVGTLLFILTFVTPVRVMTRAMPLETRRQFIILTFLLVGCSLADRSSVPFIYLGMFAVALRIVQPAWRQRSGASAVAGTAA
jgi:hypothetical protein